MERFAIDHPHNEASGLVHLSSREIAERYGWQEAFWIVSDEGTAEKAIGALGRTAAGAWEVQRLAGKRHPRSTSHTTADAEAVARAGSWVYVFGSQFGEKAGPLEPSRHWVARFNEAHVDARKGGLVGRVRVVRPAFLLHRLVNDALRAAGIDLVARGDAERDDQLAPAAEKGDAKGSGWRKRLRDDDHPINVEAATFLPHGRLLLGLRYPCTADGHPILVEIDGIDRLFARKKLRRRLGPPTVTRVAFLADVGSADAPRGFRDLAAQGTLVHAISGDLDSDPEESAVLADHPEGEGERSCHHVFELPRSTDVALSSRLVKRFGRDANVEGIAVADDGTVWYVEDAEQIVLDRLSPEEARSGRADGGRAAAPEDDQQLDAADAEGEDGLDAAEENAEELARAGAGHR